MRKGSLRITGFRSGGGEPNHPDVIPEASRGVRLPVPMLTHCHAFFTLISGGFFESPPLLWASGHALTQWGIEGNPPRDCCSPNIPCFYVTNKNKFLECSSRTSHLNCLWLWLQSTEAEAYRIRYQHHMEVENPTRLSEKCLRDCLKTFTSTAVFLQPRVIFYLELWCWHWIINTARANTHVQLHNTVRQYCSNK